MESLISSKRTENTASHEEDSEDDIEFVGETVLRPVLDCIDLLSSGEEDCSSSSNENVKCKDHIDYQKEKVTSTLDRLARHVEVEKQLKEEKNKAFKPQPSPSIRFLPPPSSSAMAPAAGKGEAAKKSRKQGDRAARNQSVAMEYQAPHHHHHLERESLPLAEEETPPQSLQELLPRHLIPTIQASTPDSFVQPLLSKGRLLLQTQQAGRIAHRKKPKSSKKGMRSHKQGAAIKGSGATTFTAQNLKEKRKAVSAPHSSEESDWDSNGESPSAKFLPQEKKSKVAAMFKPVQQSPQGQVSAELNKRRASGLRLPKAQRNEIPFPSAFLRLVEEEWEKPLQGKRGTKVAQKLYRPSKQVLDILKVPTVDPPVAALVSGSLKDPEEKRSEEALKKAHEAAALAIRASAAGSLFTKAALVWVEDILQGKLHSHEAVRRSLSWIYNALQFVADASLDSMVFAARSIGAITVARRIIWLKHWGVDTHLIANLSTAPFKGSQLFREEDLKDILVKTRANQHAMSTVSRRRDKKGAERPFQSPSSFRLSRGSSR